MGKTILGSMRRVLLQGFFRLKTIWVAFIASGYSRECTPKRIIGPLK
jgi:hypothetical protein